MGAAKLHEWVASPAVVTCVALGPRSHQVLASGGEDKRANVWRLRPGDPGAQNVWSLGGNSSPISCLCFDDAENTLVSGAQGGSVRLYDLTEGRCARALNGHRNEVLCCHTHPFGDFLASGGADEAVRVWDARKKSCIQLCRKQPAERPVQRKLQTALARSNRSCLTGRRRGAAAGRRATIAVPLPAEEIPRCGATRASAAAMTGRHLRLPGGLL